MVRRSSGRGDRTRLGDEEVDSPPRQPGSIYLDYDCLVNWMLGKRRPDVKALAQRTVAVVTAVARSSSEDTRSWRGFLGG